MDSKLAASLEGMVSYMKDMKAFFLRTDVPVGDIIKLLGRDKPGGSFSGVRVIPHDKRFKVLMVWFSKNDPGKIQSVAFHFPDYPVRMKEAEELFGKFTLKYNPFKKFTLFLAEGFTEEEAIQDFSFRLEGINVREKEDGTGFIAVPPEGGREQEVTSEDIWFDNYVFFLRDREWVSGKNDDKFTNPLGGFMRPKPKSKPKK